MTFSICRIMAFTVFFKFSSIDVSSEQRAKIFAPAKVTSHIRSNADA